MTGRPPLSERLSKRLRDPLSGVSNEDRSEYQTRYRQTLREQEIALVEDLMEKGATFDPDELGKTRPGEILERLKPGGLIGSDKYNPEQMKEMSDTFGLQVRTEELRAQIEALGGTAPPSNKGPSGIQRAFDIISRPNFAVQEMVDSSFESQAEGNGFMENLGASLQGAGRGLTGKDKTTAHDNLKEHGIPAVGMAPMKEGKATGALGFVLDVATDPTTYLTLGTGTAVKEGLKQAGKVTGKKLAAEGIEDLVEEGAEKVMARTLREAASSEQALGGTGSKTARRSIREQAVEFAKAEAKAAGQKLTTKELDEVGDRALREAEDAAAKRSADTAVEARRLTESLASTKQVELKFMGKKIAASEKLYRPIRGVSSTARGTRVGGALNRAFRTDAEVGGEIRRLERVFSNRSAAMYEDQLRQIQKVFSGSSKSERKMVSHAIEEGSTKAISGSPRMMVMHDEAKRWLKRTADDEIEAGALKPEDILDNYIYHIYERRPKRKIGGAVPTRKGKYKSLKEAAAHGARPVEDIADILAHRLAKSHKITSKYDLHTEVAKRFGINIGSSTIKDKALRRLAKDGYITSGKKVSRIMPEGVYFDVEVADSLRKLDEFFASEESIRSFVKTFDRIQAKFKFAMTAPNPGFHIRNLLGDFTANMLDGVVDPRVYDYAFKIMRDKEFRGTLRVGKNSVSSADVRMLYEGQGLKSGFFHADTGFIPSPGKRVISAASSAVRTASEFREDWMRMAHFVDALKKEASTKKGAQLPMETLAEKAAARVKKFNFDYQDLTPLERRIFRRAIPFYTFMRKNIPLQLEMLFTRPGRVAVIPKGLRAMQEMIGEAPGEDPFPGLPEVVPDWIREMPAAQMQAGDMTQPSVFLQPDFPVNQLQDYLGGFMNDSGQFDPSGGIKQLGTEITGAATPVISIPTEYVWQRDLQSGAPMDQSFLETVLSQIPAYGTMKAVRDPDEGQQSQKVTIGGKRVPERLLNYLTGAGVRVNTPQRQQSQLRRDEDILRAILEALEADLERQAG